MNAALTTVALLAGALLTGAAAAATAPPPCAPVAPPPVGGDQISVQPDDRGQSLLQAIRSARHSVDIVVYEINDPALNAELACAVRRGVNVRIVVNGQWWIPTGQAPTKLAFAKQVLGAIQAPPGSTKAGRVAVNWASNNFQITHQKTVLIDAHDGNGAPLSPLPATAQAQVLTGNLLAYGYDTARPSACKAPCAFWTARDFYVRLVEPTLVSEIARVFHSDFSCAGPKVTNGLRDTALPLTWSNGSTGIPPAPAGSYPAQGVYPYFPQGAASAADPGPGVDQGNARARMLQVIAAAQRTLDVYNEEMADTQVVDALAAAATRLVRAGGRLRVVMTADSKNDTVFAKLTTAGALVNVFPARADVLYIHAKVLMADSSSAYIGSTNISSASMNFNRELGLLITAQPALLAPVVKTFDEDFGKAKPWSPAVTATAVARPAATASFSKTQPAQTCGPILASGPAALER